MKGLNLSTFRKIASDKKTTTLQHEDGHQIKIMHGALPTLQRKALEKLPMHAMADEAPKKMAEGGKVEPKKYAEGTPDEPVSSDDNALSTSEVGKSLAAPTPVSSQMPDTTTDQTQAPAPDQLFQDRVDQQAKSLRQQNYSHLSEEDINKQAQSDVLDKMEREKSNADTIAQAAANAAKAKIAMAAPAPAANDQVLEQRKSALGITPPPSTQNAPTTKSIMPSPQDPGPAIVKPPAPPVQDYGMGQEYNNVVGGVQQAQMGLQQGQQAEAKIGAAKAIADASEVSQQQEIQRQTMRNANEFQGHVDETVQAIRDGKLNPNHYLQSMNTSDRIGTAIGMIAGGFKQGLIGGDNPAVTFLDKQIERDIDAQKNAKEDQKTILGMYEQKFGKGQEALQMARATQQAIYAAKINQAADNQSNLSSKAALNQAAGKLRYESAATIQSVAQKKAMLEADGLNGIPWSLLSKEQQESAINLPSGKRVQAMTPDDAKEIKKQVASIYPATNILDKLDNLGPSALLPGSIAAKQAESLRGQLVLAMNQSEGLKRLSHEDIMLMQQMANDPTKFSNLLGGKAKSDQLRNFMQDRMLGEYSARLVNPMAANGQQRNQAPIKSFKPSK